MRSNAGSRGSARRSPDRDGPAEQRPLSPGAQQATFRTSVDLVAVDVQVVDRDGIPVSTLGRGDFEVTIDGRKRRIVSATFLDSLVTNGVAPPVAGTSSDIVDTGAAGRTVILAIDAGSFDDAESVRVMQAARMFVAALPASDEVGVFTLMQGAPVLDTPHSIACVCA